MWDPASLTPRGHIVSEAKAGETYRARVRLDRPRHVLVKITWSPDLAATVDGRSATLLHVTPGFGAVAVPAGEHEVVVNYEPGIPALLLGAMRPETEAPRSRLVALGTGAAVIGLGLGLAAYVALASVGHQTRRHLTPLDGELRRGSEPSSPAATRPPRQGRGRRRKERTA